MGVLEEVVTVFGFGGRKVIIETKPKGSSKPGRRFSGQNERADRHVQGPCAWQREHSAPKHQREEQGLLETFGATGQGTGDWGRSGWFSEVALLLSARSLWTQEESGGGWWRWGTAGMVGAWWRAWCDGLQEGKASKVQGHVGDH